MTLTAPERETIVNQSDGARVVHIFSAQAAVIRKLRNHPYATETTSGSFEGTEWANFILPSDKYSPVTGIKRYVSEDERRRLASRLASNTANKRRGHREDPARMVLVAGEDPAGDDVV